MNIQGNTVLITGGASGIGRSLALMFAENGSAVVAAGRDVTNLGEIRRAHENISTIQCDLSTTGGQDKLVEKVLQEHREINVLINNAGVQYNYYLTEASVTPSRIDEEITVNFTAVARLSALLIPLLRTKPSAAIVNIASGLAFAPKENAPVYCATKSAVHTLTMVLRYQLEKTKIRVFELIPPLVDTEMTAGRGSGKISPREVAAAFREAWLQDRYEVAIGKIRTLRAVMRWMPGLIERKMRYSG